MKMGDIIEALLTVIVIAVITGVTLLVGGVINAIHKSIMNDDKDE